MVTTGYFNKIANMTNVFHEFSDKERAEFQNCLLNIYLDIASVCEKHNLCIMLSGGSALGAIRHQGFIPWDDDFDAMMPRKDLNKLLEIFDEELGDKYFNSGVEWNNTFIEVIKKNTLLYRVYNNENNINNGIKIDIFPIENAPTGKLKRKMVSFVANSIRILIACKNTFINKNSVYKKCLMITFKFKVHYYMRYLIGMLFSFIPRKTLYFWFYKLVTGFKDNAFCVIPMGSRYYMGEFLPKNVFTPTKKVMFEGKEVNIPNDVDTYLKNLYGDYMKIPPVEERQQHFILKLSYDTTKK